MQLSKDLKKWIKNNQNEKTKVSNKLTNKFIIHHSFNLSSFFDLFLSFVIRNAALMKVTVIITSIKNNPIKPILDSSVCVVAK